MKKSLHNETWLLLLFILGHRSQMGLSDHLLPRMVLPDLMDRDIFIKIKKTIIPNKVLVATFSFIPTNSVPKEWEEIE